MLRIGDAVATHAAAAQVGNSAHIAGAPSVSDDILFGSDTQIGANLQATALLDGKVGVPHDRGVGHDAGSPDDEVGFKGLTGGEFDLAVYRAGQLGVKVNLSPSRGQIVDNPQARLE